MRCCVSGCRNDSAHTSKSQGISFHQFPTEESARNSWLVALNRGLWQPKSHSSVCSEHFLPNHLYSTRNGLVKVRNGAVPVLKLGNADQNSTNSVDPQSEQDPNIIQACRICLATDCKMYLMSEQKLEEAYQHLTGIDPKSYSNMPDRLCVECAHKLININKFRDKSLKAHILMLDLIWKNNNLTQNLIKTIDRQSNYLTSNLKVHYKEEYDLDITYKEEKDIEKPIEKDIEKVTLHDLVEVSVEVKQEDASDMEFINEDYSYNDTWEETQDGKNNDKSTEHFEEEPDHHDDGDFIPSDSDKSIGSDEFLSKHNKHKLKKIKIKKKKSKKKEPKIDRRRKPFLNDVNGALFTIYELTFEEQIADIEKRQESSNYIHANYRCTECYKGFLDERAYNGHMSRHTTENGEHRCAVCKTHFKVKHSLIKHISAHHKHRFSCNLCSYVTTHRQTAKLHDRWHKGTKYQCPHCPEVFVNFTTYMGHVRIKHPSDFVCELCGYSFVSLKGIDLHKKLKHRTDDNKVPEDGPRCELCNIRFLNDDVYKKHLKVSGRHHDFEGKERNQTKKPKSQKRTDDENSAEKVILVPKKKIYLNDGKPEGPIDCEQCGVQLENPRSYHAHFRRQHPDKNRTNYPSMRKPAMCEVCGRMFQSYALLKDHTWVHTGEKPFKCDQCDKSFRMRQRLVAHKKVHNQVKASYACSVCDKQFSTHSNRQRHMFIHTGLKPFTCEMCGKCFKHASEKRAHISYVHQKKPWPKRNSRAKRNTTQQKSVGAVAGELDLPTGWPCEKIDNINHVLDDKPMYYNMKM